MAGDDPEDSALDGVQMQELTEATTHVLKVLDGLSAEQLRALAQVVQRQLHEDHVVQLPNKLAAIPELEVFAERNPGLLATLLAVVSVLLSAMLSLQLTSEAQTPPPANVIVIVPPLPLPEGQIRLSQGQIRQLVEDVLSTELEPRVDAEPSAAPSLPSPEQRGRPSPPIADGRKTGFSFGGP